MNEVRKSSINKAGLRTTKEEIEYEPDFKFMDKSYLKVKRTSLEFDEQHGHVRSHTTVTLYERVGSLSTYSVMYGNEWKPVEEEPDGE